MQTLQQQQKEAPLKPTQGGQVRDGEGEMIQALQSTLRVLQAERTRQSTELSRQPQSAQGKKDRESTSPTEMKSPKARRRRSSAK